MVDNTANLCMNCMTHGLRSDGVCSSCGADERALGTSPHHLRPRTLLNNKYLVGRVIGEGGFGITYVGWDAALSIKIAIKEYYPSGFVSRYSTDSMTVQSYSGDKGAFFAQGRDRFIKEAQRLARFFGLPGIVSVKDFFNENGTAYIIMEFLEGASMRSVLSNMGERMQEAHVLEIMKPLIRSLGDMHKSGLIHRDIAPDNIMILPDGSVKLIDFGAAREVTTDGQSTVAVMKHGYTPEEQYDSDHTRQGPWTDVYALCATIYRAIEGVTPPDAISRLRSDTFRGFTVPVSANTSRVVMKGLALAPENRWHDVGEMWQELYTPAAGSYAAQPAAQHVYQQQGQPSAPARVKPNKMIAAMIGGGAVLIMLIILIAALSGSREDPVTGTPPESIRTPSGPSDSPGEDEPDISPGPQEPPEQVTEPQEPPEQVMEEEPWRDAYAEFLREPTRQSQYDSFTLYDIDKNGVPELILALPSADYYSTNFEAYSFFNGNIIDLGGLLSWHSGYGDSPLYIPTDPEKSLIFTFHSGMGKMRIESLGTYAIIDGRLTETSGGYDLDDLTNQGIYENAVPLYTYDIIEPHIINLIYGYVSLNTPSAPASSIAELFSRVSYVGDVTNCRMTERQAQAYIDVLKTYIESEGHLYMLTWDGFGPCVGSVPYAILIDLDGDGIPLLLLATQYFYGGGDLGGQEIWQFDGAAAVKFELPNNSTFFSLQDNIIIFISQDYDGTYYEASVAVGTASNGMISIEHTSSIGAYDEEVETIMVDGAERFDYDIDPFLFVSWVLTEWGLSGFLEDINLSHWNPSNGTYSDFIFIRAFGWVYISGNAFKHTSLTQNMNTALTEYIEWLETIVPDAPAPEQPSAATPPEERAERPSPENTSVPVQQSGNNTILLVIGIPAGVLLVTAGIVQYRKQKTGAAVVHMQTPVCRKCGNSEDEATRFCTKCGAEMPKAN